MCIAVIFALLWWAQFSQQTTRETKSIDFAAYELELKGILALKANPATASMATTEAEEIIKKVEPMRLKDPGAAETYGLVMYELGKTLKPEDAKQILSAPYGAAISQVLTTPKFTPAEAEALAPKLPFKSFGAKLLRADLFEKAKLPQDRKEIIAEAGKSAQMEYGLIGFVLLGGLITAIVVVNALLKGELKPRGLPIQLDTPMAADRLALKAAVFFTIYLVLLEAPGLAAKNSPYQAWIALVGGIATVVLFPLLVRVPWGGPEISSEPPEGEYPRPENLIKKVKFSFGNLGLSRNAPWIEYFSLGALAFLIEFPLTLVMAKVGDTLFPNQSLTHPAEAELLASHGLVTVIGLFVLASIQAPLFEETIFRGFLFPAISKVSKSLIVGVVVSSFLFASIHPQGIGLWLGLSTIAATSAVLTYYSRSIGPSIFMHALHNGFTLVLVLILS